MAEAPEPLQLFATGGGGVPQTEAANEASAQASLQRVRRTSRLATPAQERFAVAVQSARGGGCSWREIGSAAGIPYQTLHRRFCQTPTSEGQVPGRRV